MVRVSCIDAQRALVELKSVKNLQSLPCLLGWTFAFEPRGLTNSRGLSFFFGELRKAVVQGSDADPQNLRRAKLVVINVF